MSTVPDSRGRWTRRQNNKKAAHRSEAERDRDRILYSPAFRRLASVTQVVSPTAGHIVHNRLTHSLEVAQIARRLAQRLATSRISAGVQDVDPDVAEAAALAHDLGHPPFGHVAEEELDKLVCKAGVLDGFNGNAQSFRIITKLSLRDSETEGLDLTAATLDAVLKYPWFRQTSGDPSRKWGAYHSEEEDFEHARRFNQSEGQQRSVEAEVMDWADDIAYSVHDVEDFFRAGLIPLDQFLPVENIESSEEAQAFLKSAESSSRVRRLDPIPNKAQLTAALSRALGVFPSLRSYDDSLGSQAGLSMWKSDAIGRYIQALELCDPEQHEGRRARISDDLKDLEVEVAVLKELTWYYVINSPRTASQRHGQRRVVKALFTVYARALSGDESIFPKAQQDWLRLVEELATNQQRLRIVVDLIASMTERQAVSVFNRLSGLDLQSTLGPEHV